MTKRGSALLLVLVLSLAVLPAAGTLVYIARSDLASALDDYHHTRARQAARGSLALAGASLLAGGEGRVTWPDPGVAVELSVTETDSGWHITVTAQSDRAVTVMAADYEKEDADN